MPGFGDREGRATARPSAAPGTESPTGHRSDDSGSIRRAVRVLPDVSGLDKEFDYLVPDGWHVEIGDLVRIDLHGRRVRGWVLGLDVESDPGIALRPLAKVSSRGPDADVLDLARWAAWRWAGRRGAFLRTASPPGVVKHRPAGGAEALVRAAERACDPLDSGEELLERALAADRAVLRLPPGADRLPFIVAAARDAASRGGSLLILCPSVDEARRLGRLLSRRQMRAAVMADDSTPRSGADQWAKAAEGADVVVGTRSAAWASVPRLARVVVLDEHDEAHQQQQSPTWHARDVVAERARRSGAPMMVISPCPSLEAMAWGELVAPDRVTERTGWSRIELVDQRDLDPALGPLFSPRLVEVVRGPGPVLCILNRTGRSRLLACTACASVARCEVCDSSVADLGEGHLSCGRCGGTRPMVCANCGGGRLKNLRLGVSRVREELEVLVGEPVAEVTATGSAQVPSRVVVGTEAALHRVDRAGSVVFMDFDQELLAPRYRASEQAMALLVRAARVVYRGRAPGGRVLVQTRSPDHPVLDAAGRGDPGRLVADEARLRALLGQPPAVAVALISGPAASEFISGLAGTPGVKVQGPVDEVWRLVAPTHVELCDALAAVERPAGRLRIEVDPLRS